MRDTESYKRKVIRDRLKFWKSTYEKLQKAYVALIEGGAKYYMIDDRQLSKLDLPELRAAMEEAERKVDELEAALNGSGVRKAFGVLPRDW